MKTSEEYAEAIRNRIAEKLGPEIDVALSIVPEDQREHFRVVYAAFAALGYAAARSEMLAFLHSGDE